VVKSLVEALQQIGSNGIFQDQIAVEIKEEIISAEGTRGSIKRTSQTTRG